MATWYITDGDLPFLEDFPENPERIDDTPNVLWRIIDGDDPFRLMFPDVYTINDAPTSYWRIIDGDDPFRLAFPQMPKPPRIEKRYKGKHSKIIIPIYKQTIPVGKVLRSDPPPG